MMSPAMIFTIFFITLGPIKILGPFARQTRGADDGVVRQIAVRAFLMATISAIAGGFLGATLMANWHISLGAMVLAGGLVFLLVAIRQLLDQYEPSQDSAAGVPALPASPTAAALKLLFPTVLTPFGIAAVIVLLGGSADSVPTGVVVGILVGVMLLNLVAMLFARRILAGIGIIVLQILGGVLGMLQAGLAVQIILRGLKDLNLISF